ncbi:MAG: adenylate/guanylate cyclase domain-containing protein [Defluviitaleaceae bacterium]|nr:adenylate/guanylate cyclase domain-containing protein [Defluviitaleaceae bacterium]
MNKSLRIVLPALLFLIFVITQHFGWFSAINYIIHDNVMVSSRAPSDEIIIVGIDQRTINEIGTWPHPRLYVAEAIERLSENGAAVIGVNILYSTYGAFPEYDEYLVASAKAAEGRLVLGGEGILAPAVSQDPNDLLLIDDYELPFGALAAVSNIGFLNAIHDADGVMRRSLTTMRFGDITVNSFPLEVYNRFRYFRGEESLASIPLDANGQFPIRFVGGPDSFTAVSLWGVINEYYPSAMFRDAIVLIGPFAAGIGDGNFTTPLERQISTHGVELYANIIQNFMEGIFVSYAPWWVNLLAMVVCLIIIIALFHWIKPFSGFIISVGLIVALLFGVRLAYTHLYLIINIGDVIVFLVFGYIAKLIFGIVYVQYEKQHIKGLFGRFVAPEVVAEIISGGVDVQLGGVVKEISALFVDIRGFTAFSETNPPERVVDIINRYLGLTSRAIQGNKGTIDKFMGDATMALFNAPNDVPGHALCAVQAAWAMKKGSASIQKEILDEYGIDLQFGVGINTGTAVVGNMGSDFRMDYTAIGDTINTAARLEANAEKGQIIISDATYQQVKDYVEVIDMGVINVKNKQVGIQIYSVVLVK